MLPAAADGSEDPTLDFRADDLRANDFGRRETARP